VPSGGVGTVGDVSTTVVLSLINFGLDDEPTLARSLPRISVLDVRLTIMGAS
jgi:hypothetical protein